MEDIPSKRKPKEGLAILRQNKLQAKNGNKRQKRLLYDDKGVYTSKKIL